MNQLHKLYIHPSDTDSDIPEWKAFTNVVSIGRNTIKDVRLILVDNVVTKQFIEEIWVGIIPLPKPFRENTFIEEFVTTGFWHRSQKYCRGLFVFHISQKQILIACGVKVPVAILPLHYDNKFIDSSFNLSQDSKDILYIGGGAENVLSLIEKAPGYNVTALSYNNSVANDIEEKGITVLRSLNAFSYKSFLNSSIVIIDGPDELRNLTVIHDCMHNGNPIIISNSSLFKNVLGAQYPLFYNYPDEVLLFLDDFQYLNIGQQYLKLQKERRSKYEKSMLQGLKSSAIYQSINETDIDKVTFNSFDLSVVLFIPSHVKEERLQQILESIISKPIGYSCEYIIWNSNALVSDSLDSFYIENKYKIELKVIGALGSQPSNCIEAMGSLVRSPYILFIHSLVELNSCFIDHLWQNRTKGDNHLYLAPITYEASYDSSNSEVNDQYAYLFQTSLLKKSLLFSSPKINELRKSGLAFSYIFSNHMHLPVVVTHPVSVENKKVYEK